MLAKELHKLVETTKFALTSVFVKEILNFPPYLTHSVGPFGVLPSGGQLGLEQSLVELGAVRGMVAGCLSHKKAPRISLSSMLY